MAEIKRGRSESDWKEQSRGRKKKKKQDRLERTEKQRESKSISYVIMSHCASHRTFA